jgi:hypothetical protein
MYVLQIRYVYFFLHEQFYCDLILMKFGTTNIISDATGMECIRVKPTVKVFPENYFFTFLILSLILSCIHAVYKPRMFVPL